MNGTIGARANAGGNPSRYSASHESAPQMSTYGQNARTCFRRSHAARPTATAISNPLPPARVPSNRNDGARAVNPIAFDANARTSRKVTAGWRWNTARTTKQASTMSMPARFGQPSRNIGTVDDRNDAA